MYKDTSFVCAFNINGNYKRIHISETGSSSIGYNYATDSILMNFDVRYEKMDSNSMDIIFQKFEDPDEINGFIMHSPGDWECSLSMQDISMAFKEGYFRNVTTRDPVVKKDRIHIAYGSCDPGRIGVSLKQEFFFDMTKCYDSPPDSGGYFHLYDVQTIGDCAITFSADFEGMTDPNDFYVGQITDGHLKGLHINWQSNVCVN